MLRIVPSSLAAMYVTNITLKIAVIMIQLTRCHSIYNIYVYKEQLK
jgi:hypothetical protein